MNRATPALRRIARDLMAFQAPRGESAAAQAGADFRTIEKLRPQLANLMGAGGFRALLARALVLASAEVSWLSAVNVKADGTLEFAERPGQFDTAEYLEGGIVLLAQLLGLLVAFVGPSLTSRLVGEVWPKFPSTGWISVGEEVRDEKAR